MQRTFNKIVDILYNEEEYTAEISSEGIDSLRFCFTYPEQVRNIVYQWDIGGFKVTYGELSASYTENRLPHSSPAFEFKSFITALYSEGGYSCTSSDKETAYYEGENFKFTADFKSGEILTLQFDNMQADFRR